jgi:hypothetical protein
LAYKTLELIEMLNKSNLHIMLKIANTRNYANEVRKSVEAVFYSPLIEKKELQAKNYCDDELDELFHINNDELNFWRRNI